MIINHIDNDSQTLDFQGGYKTQSTKVELEKYRFIDLFAGIGGFRMGFTRKYSKCVFSSEWDRFACETYYKNFKEKPFGDINELNPKDLEDFEILLGGFPCQPFSKIGRREGFKHKTQGNLFFNIVNIIKEKNPISFVLENVSGLLTHKSGNESTMEIITDILSELGYEVNIGLLDSADFGLPQHRRRVFLVGFLKREFSEPTQFKFPNPKKKKVFINEILEENVSGYEISNHLQNVYIHKAGKPPEIVDRNSKIIAKTLVSSYHKIQRITGTFVKDGPTGLRLLSENECKSMMGFPKNFKFPVSRTQMYRQLGNSVTVPVIKSLSKEVFKVLDKKYNRL